MTIHRNPDLLSNAMSGTGVSLVRFCSAMQPKAHGRDARATISKCPQKFPRLALPFAWTCALVLLTSAASAADSPAAAGITEPFLHVTLSTAVPGIITVQKFREGDFVKEGDVLLELDKKIEELEVERRKLVRDQKWSDFDTTQKLFKTTKGISKEEVEKKEAEYKVAAVEHDMAVEQLRRRQVISPLSGTISEILLDPGEACQPYQALIRVVDTRRCYFITHIEASLAVRLNPDQTVKLAIDSGGGPVSVQGKIAFLSPVVDAASGLQKVKVLFDNTDAKIRPGVSGKMLLE